MAQIPRQKVAAMKVTFSRTYFTKASLPVENKLFRSPYIASVPFTGADQIKSVSISRNSWDTLFYIKMRLKTLCKKAY